MDNRDQLRANSMLGVVVFHCDEPASFDDAVYYGIPVQRSDTS